MNDEPTITRNEDGTLWVSWPDPPRPTYEIAHEALQFLVDDYNEVVAEVERHDTYGDGWADGEQFVLDNWRDYAIRRHVLGRAWIWIWRAVQRRFGWGMYAHPVREVSDV